MKIPDIGDVMNKFEVLGIVGEGKSGRYLAVLCVFVSLQETVRASPVLPFMHTLMGFLFYCFYPI